VDFSAKQIVGAAAAALAILALAAGVIDWRHR